MTNENRETSFPLKLLLNIINIEEYPFTSMVIENKLTNEEYDELMGLLQELDQTFHQQKEEGLLNYTSLLIHFAGMLTEKLSPTETIKALKKEGLFLDLMTEFMNIIEGQGYE